MLTAQELQSLAEFESQDSTVLSLYLNVDSTQKTKEEYRLSLRGMLRQVADRRVSKDVQAIERYLDLEYDGLARGLVFFSCQEQGLWRALPVAVPLLDRVIVARRPYITPIQDIFDKYGRYAVVLVEREGARLFLFELGLLSEVTGALGDALKKHKQGGRSASRLQRRADATAQHNLKEIARVAGEFCTQNACSRLILGGTTENVALFRSMLPKAIEQIIVGEMVMDTWASETDVRAKAAEIVGQYGRQQDDALVERMIDLAASEGAGVTGLEATLVALQQERVNMLVVADGYEVQGRRCTYCDYLGLVETDECPYCGAPTRTSQHVVDTVVCRAIGKGVPIKVVGGNAHLRDAGGIGALLRY